MESEKSQDWESLFGSDDDTFVNEYGSRDEYEEDLVSSFFTDSSDDDLESFDSVLTSVDQQSSQNDTKKGWTQISPSEIPGLTYIPNVLPPSVQDELIQCLPDGILDRSTGRQAHLYRPFAPVLQNLMQNFIPSAFKKQVWEGKDAEAIIMQVYNPGDGIIPHVDLPMFDDGIVIFSLLSDITMEFTQPSSKRKASVLLEKGSLTIMEGEARYQWLHGIPFRTGDWTNGTWIPRAQRCSITMRRIGLNKMFG
ncbi:2 OG-Fe(II) oxygenase superfamily protein Ofd2 [Schizosaccharomyces japonicus yFS275]|uniref:2 OG-Fe(II) oxygenase superfamily protein Ofd2 n=1 Tax=Schizosaccharomyces japonicus (strain yFS275 / FY16936) TaxID=402676 RepID=B6JV21_SCHJY|nr:2 OG-Fe(II) oxygenase superfamily protein Ofd2 [Schizosaccharomyces japonicus yFS275]EEB05222.1 2 OG-Fe(II) oxygenase superfamily protein Ofd2 [Schizosaccharomyces japonicus yFS275]